ncbi:hypothetical protein PM082_016189 [Marasmius tenuissimus]|nr:hypothetical protein PM082_016189 [Marasmius tenuissimus]
MITRWCLYDTSNYSTRILAVPSKHANDPHRPHVRRRSFGAPTPVFDQRTVVDCGGNKETESSTTSLVLPADMILDRLGSLSPELLNNTIGALEAGGMISCLLMGIVTIQVYYYYSKFPKDRVALTTMVVFVWICELGHSICISHLIYVITTVSWPNPQCPFHSAYTELPCLAYQGSDGNLDTYSHLLDDVFR